MKRAMTSWAALVVIGLCGTVAPAQEKDPRVNPPVSPLPPLQLGESSSKPTGNTPPETTQQAGPGEPESQPLSGVEQWTAESANKGRSFLVRTLRVYALADTNPFGSRQGSSIGEAVNLSGDLSLQYLRGSRDFTLMYAGGGMLYDSRTDLNQSYQQLQLREAIAGRRWRFVFNNSFAYLPSSSFGNAGVPALDQLRSVLTGGTNLSVAQLDPRLVPNQSILSGSTARVTNTFAGQVEYALGPRSSITASGSYGFLRFLDSGFNNSNQAVFNTGYNYALTARDKVGAIYSYSLIRFENLDRGIDSQFFHASYGRRISGRLAWQISAGPQVSAFQNPGVATQRVVSWSLITSLNYQLEKGSLGLLYLRSVTGGSGVLLGAQTNQVESNWARPLSRVWAGSLSFGYARNTGIQRLSGFQNLNDLRFNSWYASVRVSRPWGRRTRMNFNYQLLYQNTNSSICIANDCGRITVRHSFGVGFDFNFRPIPID
jgi:hypothetical protein